MIFARPQQRWQTRARLFHSRTHAWALRVVLIVLPGVDRWNSQRVAVSVGFSRSKMLPNQPRNSTWNSVTSVMWSFAHQEPGFLHLLPRRKPGTFLMGLVPGEADVFRHFNYDVTNSCPCTTVLFLTTACWQCLWHNQSPRLNACRTFVSWKHSGQTDFIYCINDRPIIVTWVVSICYNIHAHSIQFYKENTIWPLIHIIFVNK